MTERSAEATRELILASAATEIVGGEIELLRLSGGGGRQVWEARSARGRFIVRLATDEEPPEDLTRELRASEIMERLPVATPRIRLHEGCGQRFSVHPRIEGQTFYEISEGDLDQADRERFVADTAALLHQLHATPLEAAAEALYGGWPGPAEAVRRFGRPSWCDATAIESRIGDRLGSDPLIAERWQQVRSFFGGYRPVASDLVFGHGDLHGGNLGIVEEDGRLRLHGIFDLDNAGILNRHDELLRIVLLSSRIGPQILDAYDALGDGAPPVDRGVLLAFYRAFLFFLLHQSTSAAYSAHVVSLLGEDLPQLAGRA